MTTASTHANVAASGVERPISDGKVRILIVDDEPSMREMLRIVLRRDGYDVQLADSGREAICVHGEVSGTVSASIAILSDANHEFEFFHCPGAPCQNSFAAAVKLPIQ